MKVPLLDVNAQNLPLESELVAAFTRVLRSGAFILGPEVEKFEAEMAAFLGVEHAIGVSSGTDAILLALMALGIGPGDEVLVPTFTFFATAGCVSRVGATPVFVDSCPVCFNIDVTDAKRKITSRTKAAIPVHLFGQSAEMASIASLASRHGLHVIEDGAQALGATYHDVKCGTMGDFGTFSFFPSKNLGGLGDGGLLVSRHPELAQKARLLRTHGSHPKYYHKYVGGNFRLDALQAALLRVKLPHYSGWTEGRRTNAAYYLKALGALPGVITRAAATCPGRVERSAGSGSVRLVLPAAHEASGHIWNQFTIRVEGPGARDSIRRHLGAAAVGTEIYYPVTMDRQECFGDTPAASRQGCEVAHSLADTALSLPIYPELTSAQREFVVDSVANWLEAAVPAAVT